MSSASSRVREGNGGRIPSRSGYSTTKYSSSVITCEDVDRNARQREKQNDSSPKTKSSRRQPSNRGISLFATPIKFELAQDGRLVTEMSLFQRTNVLSAGELCDSEEHRAWHVSSSGYSLTRKGSPSKNSQLYSSTSASSSFVETNRSIT